MPKKALVRSLDVWNTVKQAEEFGITVSDASLHWDKVMERKDEIVGKFTGGKGPYLEKLGVDLLLGDATFTSPDSITVNGKEYRSKKFLIGTGSTPFLAPIEGIEHAITSKEVFKLKKLPKSIVILGGGVISLEFAHIFANAGVDVTVIQRSDVLLKSQDAETSQYIKEISEKHGITIKTNTTVDKMVKDNNEVIVHCTVNGDAERFTGEVVLAATGRKPLLEGLGLEAAGVEYSEHGIKVNEYFQTSQENIYAAGDSIGGIMLTPVASFEAKVAARNAIKGNEQKIDYNLVPTAIFTLPPVASVGLTEETATAQGIAYETNKVKLSHNGVALILGETEGYIKIISEKDTRRIIGAHMVGIHADELIHQMAIAMKGKLTLDDLAAIIHIHPTISEAFMELAR
jgi:dihydrolipoamide dehydrogenase